MRGHRQTSLLSFLSVLKSKSQPEAVDSIDQDHETQTTTQTTRTTSTRISTSPLLSASPSTPSTSTPVSPSSPDPLSVPSPPPNATTTTTTTTTTTSTISISPDTHSQSAVQQEGVVVEDDTGLSSYEQLRLRNIARNNARLKALGLYKPESPVHPTKKRRVTPKSRGGRHIRTVAVASPPPTYRLRSSRRLASTETATATAPSSSSATDVETITQSSSHKQDDPPEISYTVSPIMPSYDILGADSSTPVSTTTTTPWPHSWDYPETSSSSLVPVPYSLALPPGLSAMYSLSFFQPSSPWMVGAGKSGLLAIWNAAPELVDDTTDHVNQLALDPVLSWKAHQGKWIADARFLSSTTTMDGDGQLTPVPRPTRLVSAANDGTVCLWDLTTVAAKTHVPRLLVQTPKGHLHSSGIFSLDISTDCSNTSTTQQYCVTGSKDKTIVLSDLSSSSAAFSPIWTSTHHTSKVGDVRFRGKGTSLMASAGDDGVVAVHDFRTHRVVVDCNHAHARPHSVQWDPYNEHVLMTAGHDHTIQLWDIRKWGQTPLTIFQGHVPEHVRKVTKIHRPVFYTPTKKSPSNTMILTSGQQSSSLSLFHAGRLWSRGQLPEGVDGGALAVDGARVAVSTPHQVLLLKPSSSAVSVTGGRGS